MGKIPEVATLDLASGLPTFLARFDLLEFNSLPASHFHHFGSSYGSFLRFSVPMEGLPLLERLFKRHGDFTSGFRGGVFFGKHSNGATVCHADFLERFFVRLLI